MNTKSISLMTLTTIFVTVLTFSNISPADGTRITWGVNEQKTIAEEYKIKINADGYGSFKGIISTCHGKQMFYDITIFNGKIYYDWEGVEKIKCMKKLENGTSEPRTFEWFKIFVGVWEGDGYGINNERKIFTSYKMIPTNDPKRSSSFIDAGEQLTVRVAFLFIEEGYRN